METAAVTGEGMVTGIRYSVSGTTFGTDLLVTEYRLPLLPVTGYWFNQLLFRPAVHIGAFLDYLEIIHVKSVLRVGVGYRDYKFVY